MDDKCVAITMNRQLECAICLDTWKHPVEVLPCRHVFCQPCVAGLTACPMCRSTISSTQTPTRQLVCLSDEVEVECAECHWKGTREQSYKHRCGDSRTQTRLPATTTAPRPTAAGGAAPQPTQPTPVNDTPRTTASMPESVVEAYTRDFSDQRLRRDLLELVSEPDTLRVIAKDCVNLTEITALVACTHLVEVNFAKCSNLRDLTALRGLTALKKVVLSRTAVNDISFATWCTALESVDLYGLEELCDLGPLQSCRHLKDLDISSTSVSNLAPLRGMTCLETLYARFCEQLTDLSDLQECRALKRLSVDFTSVSDLTPLRCMACLEEFWVSVCSDVRDLSPLRACRQLRILSIFDTAVSDLWPLAGLPELSMLFASRTHVSDLTGLNTCHKLSSVDFSECAYLTDISGLVGAPALTAVDVSDSPVENLYLLRSNRNIAITETSARLPTGQYTKTTSGCACCAF